MYSSWVHKVQRLLKAFCPSNNEVTRRWGEQKNAHPNGKCVSGAILERKVMRRLILMV